MEFLSVEALHKAVMSCYHGNKDKEEIMLQIQKYYGSDYQVTALGLANEHGTEEEPLLDRNNVIAMDVF